METGEVIENPTTKFTVLEDKVYTVAHSVYPSHDIPQLRKWTENSAHESREGRRDKFIGQSNMLNCAIQNIVRLFNPLGNRLSICH